jgi:hypothetical protein
MFEIHPYFTTTVQFKVTQVDKVPADSYDPKNWENGRGVYFIKENNCFYFVGKYSVDVIYGADEKGFFETIDDRFEPPKVDETLMLRIVAATHGHTL